MNASCRTPLNEKILLLNSVNLRGDYQYNGANLDGSTNSAYSTNLANYALAGYVNSDSASNVTLTLGNSLNFNGSVVQSVTNVGTYALTQGSLTTTLSGANGANYTVQFVNGSSYVINPKALTVSATKPYDGNATFTPSQIRISGFVGTETLQLRGTATGNSANVLGAPTIGGGGASTNNGITSMSTAG